MCNLALKKACGRFVNTRLLKICLHSLPEVHELLGYYFHLTSVSVSSQDYGAHVLSLCMHLQFNPNYKTYVLYADGGPAENVKQKKFRGGARREQQPGGGETPGDPKSKNDSGSGET